VILAYFWVSKSKYPMAHFAQLTIAQRYQIQTLNQLDIAQKDIAQHVNVSASTISRELCRNKPKTTTQYQAEVAQQQAQQRCQRSPYKLKDNLSKTVIEGLEKRWSPEQISGVVALEAGKKVISHEAIYQFIYKQSTDNKPLIQYLRIGHKKRYKKRGVAQKRGTIPNRVGIESRPTIVDTNTQVGHWEGDTVIGFDHDGALLTVVERVTKWTCIVKLSGKHAHPLARAAVTKLGNCPLPIKSITVDNGREFTQHEIITEGLKAPVFFARPYHSWERGLNENTNGLIRQYVPKQQRISSLTDEFVSSIENQLNHRPRKALGFLSPVQYVEKHRIAFQT
jgi:transposase, IS30 family